MASDGSCARNREQKSGQQPVLPNIFDVLGEEVSSPFWAPSPSVTCSQRPHTLRSYSYPALHVDPWLPRPNQSSTTSRGPTLRPMTSIKRESVLDAHQFPSPAQTISGSSSICSMDAEDCLDLQSFNRVTDRPHLDYDTVIQVASDLLEETHIAPPFAQGWFQPDNKYNRRLEGELAGMSLGEIVVAFFFRDESRALYGDRVIRPRRQAQSTSATLENSKSEEKLDTKSLEKLEKRKGFQKNHQQQEEERRDRHRSCQHDSHERCPEIAAKCGAEHAREDKITTRPQAGKGPGKDEQLFSSIYTQEMAGRVVQALNGRRLRAENMVRLLLRVLQRQHDPSLTESESHQCRHEAVRRTSFSRPSYVGIKRTRDETAEEQQRTWTRIRYDSDVIDSRVSPLTEGDRVWK